MIAFIDFIGFFEVALLIDPLTDGLLPLIVDIAKSQDRDKLHEILDIIPYPIHDILKEKLSAHYAADVWTTLGSELTRQHIPYNQMS